MLLNDFSGGLNSRVYPTLLDRRESQIYTNCDNETGILQPVPAPKVSTLESKAYATYYVAGDRLVSTDNSSVYWAEYRDTLYSVSDFGNYKETVDGTIQTLGIPSSNIAPTVTIGESGTLSGTYSYVYTYYNEVDGTESAPSPLSEIEVTDSQVVITAIQSSSNLQVTHIRLYRLGGTLTQYTLVEELFNSTISLTYIDNLSDSQIVGQHILDSYENFIPPSNLKYLTLAYSMLFAGLKDKLYFSGITTPDYWSRTNYIDFDEDITGIGETSSGLLVFTENKTYIITGTTPLTFTKYLLNGENGCINHRTIQFISNTLLWVSKNGVCSSNGGEVTILTLPKVGIIRDKTINAIVCSGIYLLSFVDRILLLDFRYNLCIRELNYTGWLVSNNNRPYLKKTDTSTLLELCHNSIPSSMHYKSPIITEGRYSELKYYKDFYISYEGDITLKVYIDDTAVLDTVLDPAKRQFNLKSLSSIAGYGVTIEILGTGKVFEIDFKAVGRENAK